MQYSCRQVTQLSSMDHERRSHCYRMPISVSASVLLCLLISSTTTDPVLSEESFTFARPVHNIATGSQHVLVATENNLYLFNHKLHNLAMRQPGSDIEPKENCAGKKEVPKVFFNKILLVYNDTVLSCWNEYSGTCVEYDVHNLTGFKDSGQDIVSCNPEHTATGFIVLKDDKINFVTAAPVSVKKNSDIRAITVRRKENDNVFVPTTESALQKIRSPVLNYVDAFKLDRKFVFPYYLSNGLGARLFVMEDNLEALIFSSQFNLTCGKEPGTGHERVVILSSFAFASSGNFFWAGIFSTNRTTSPERTALCIYNITFITTISKGCIHTDFNAINDDNCKTYDNPLPLNSKPTISHGDLTAVYVLEVDTALVLFLGTGNGQLMKVTLNSKYEASCPQILHEFKSEAAVFRTIRLDPFDNTYLYVATMNEIKRVRVAKCEQFQSCNECLASADPHCGWCLVTNRCTMKTECQATSLEDWVGTSKNEGKCLGIHVTSANESQITMLIKKNDLLFGTSTSWSCKLQQKDKVLCSGNSDKQNCSCRFLSVESSNQDVLTAIAVHKNQKVEERFQFNKCSQYSGFSCLDCISNGCLYCTKESECRSPLTPCDNKADEADCKDILQRPPQNVKVNSVQPNRVIYPGRKNVLITGENLQNLSRLFLVGSSSCKPQEIPIQREKHWNSTHAFISLPSAKEAKQLCVHFDGMCHESLNIFYVSLPTCSLNSPQSVWSSGGRKLSLSGKGLDLVDQFSIANTIFDSKDVECSENKTRCYFIARPQSEINQPTFSINVHIEENKTTCGIVHYKPDPEFTSFSADNIGSKIDLKIRKKNDSLHIRPDEIQIKINSSLTCEIQNITELKEEDIVQCTAKMNDSRKIDVKTIEVKVILGNFTKTLRFEETKVPKTNFWYTLIIIPLVLVIVIATCLITRYKSKQLSDKLSKQLEQLECDIREEIRTGFAEFQMDREVVTVEALGTIPFFDYKHFALKTFFPESDRSKQDLSEKLCETVPSPFQKNPKIPTDEDDIVSSLRNLFQNQNFLVILIHALEKQKDFTIKDRCFFASFLTIIFQNNLLYLTGLLETLTKDLIEQSSNKHPKLMLRRTESVVEKLLTNWMTTCLYGFLRESVGEPLYGLVCALNQRIHQGPIDVVTCKALYTLNEDSLLWQVTDFNNVDINVHFPTSEGEAVHDSSQHLKVTVLDCDTIRQVKEKILQTFLSKNGYNFNYPQCDICLEHHFGQTFKELLDIDASTVVTENGLKKLNTVKHYKIQNGATIKIIIRKNCDPVKEYSNDYVHLELPESEENDDLQSMENKGKHKFKVKEMYLTKLLSTKVAIHSSVEKLFRSIWTISNKPPVAIKYFFDFLDNQGEIRKVSDPDILHYWKTNSLPLRFWVNILKNPQFVLDIKKTALLDSCLSVIAQAFMDGFSLTEQQLGKSAPTNKLLYAKDIPQFKEEIRSYYKDIRDAPPLSSSELSEFLTSESKKHEHEFKDDVAILELYKYIEKFNDVIVSILEKEGGYDSEVKQLLKLQKLSSDKKKCTWE